MCSISVIGIGSMGGGIARSLLRSSATTEVIGYDKSTDLSNSFYNECKDKTTLSAAPRTLREAITNKTKFVIIVLVNQQQCDQVCFGINDDDDNSNIISLIPDNACVIICSTVSATWMKEADEKFQSKSRNIHFVDCPISGGPARAAKGDLTLMASGSNESLQIAKPILDAMGTTHSIPGGVGMGSTVKMVHQLLAGVHIAVAAEALALAAKAGLDVKQMYDIVNSAAGASWMFEDRGKRMIATDGSNDEVKSALNIFVKDLDIVYKEAKILGSPIPIASTVIQQFISGQSMGLGKKDDSQVVKVYERITGVPVGGRRKEYCEEGNGTSKNEAKKENEDTPKKRKREAVLQEIEELKRKVTKLESELVDLDDS